MNIPETCSSCIYFTGEECTGKFEGQERYSDSSACDEFCELEEQLLHNPELTG